MTLPNKNIFNYTLWDSHVHIFPQKMMQAVFAFFDSQYGWKLPFSTDPNRLLEILKLDGAEKAFALAYTHKPDLSRPLNAWLNSFCSANPMLTPFGAVHPLDRNLEQVVEECLDNFNFPGLKLHCMVQRCRPDHRILRPLFKSIEERSRGIIIHAGSFPQPDHNFLDISYIRNVLERYPGLNLIIPHMGLNELSAYEELLSEHEGLFLDTAFVFQNSMVQTPVEKIVETILNFPDRILYGSDFPLILEPPLNGIRRILSLELPEKVYEKLFHDNAEAFLQRIST